MSFWQSLAGEVSLELKCADPSYALSQLQEHGITVRKVRIADEFTICFRVNRQQQKAVKAVADKRGFELRIKSREGLFWLLPRLLQRPVLLFGTLLLICTGLFLPSRVLFIQVEGNSAVATRLILEAAAECGIEFGASRAEVRSEKMKNALLESLPQLQWAGINTAGCVAVISVRERQIPEATQGTVGVASIIAARDGIITSITATKGNPLCRPGQAVKAGQTLISGYTDCGFTIQAQRAEGEVYAKTERELTLITPTNQGVRGPSTVTEKKYSLIIGKKRINLYFGSGILDASCVKMYVENYVTLPGGFQLPVALVTESWTQAVSDTMPETETTWLSEAALEYLSGEMIAGQILSMEETISQEDGICVLHGRYACLEMIGQLRQEEILKPDGTND